MSYYKDRLTTTLTASLIQWRLRENGFVEGIIARSVDEEYKDGELFILNGKLTHYPYASGFWPDHFILSNSTGKHFFMSAKEQLNDTPLA